MKISNNPPRVVPPLSNTLMYFKYIADHFHKHLKTLELFPQNLCACQAVIPPHQNHNTAEKQKKKTFTMHTKSKSSSRGARGLHVEYI